MSLWSLLATHFTNPGYVGDLIKSVEIGPEVSGRPEITPDELLFAVYDAKNYQKQPETGQQPDEERLLNGSENFSHI
jgi:hypothetical protein